MEQRIDANHVPLSDETIEGGTWGRYRKTALTKARRMKGPFKVGTREGELQCDDGYLCIDAHGHPYPVAREEFEKIYELEPEDE